MTADSPVFLPPPGPSLVEACRERVDKALHGWLGAPRGVPARLHEAMRYAVFGGGKRIRPLLVYMTGQAVGATPEHLDGPACAVELIHAYSLVHDDLPAMDDDDLRRGRATCHRAFDEATAILAGDALQCLAFEVLASDPSMLDDPARRLRMIAALAAASGPAGMAGGQAIDLAATGRGLSLAELERMHALKTGALIKAGVVLAALTRLELDDASLERLGEYADCVGLAFQIRDDILDVEGDAETIGKQPGADHARAKPTYTSIAGLDNAKQRTRELHARAIAALAGFGPAAEPLRWLSAHIGERSS